jgi:hypothetical protein
MAADVQCDATKKPPGPRAIEGRRAWRRSAGPYQRVYRYKEDQTHTSTVADAAQIVKPGYPSSQHVSRASGM